MGQSEYEGKTVYISSDFVTTEVPKEPETSAASSNAAADGQVTLNSSWKYADFAKIKSGQQSFTAVQLLKRRIR